MPAPRAGALDRFIEFRIPSQSQDASGGVVQDFTRFARAYARREALDAPEKFQAGRNVGEDLAKYLIRYISGLTKTMILVDGSDEYDILSIREMEEFGRRRWTEILASKKE